MYRFAITTLFYVVCFFSPPFLSQAETPPTLIVVLGDSLSEGYGVTKDKSYPSLVEKKLQAAGYNVRVQDSSISGSTSSSLKGRLNWVLRQKPNIIFLAIGANDGLRGIEISQVKKNIKETVQTLKQKNIQVWLAGMQMPPNYGKKYTEQFAKVFSEIAKEEKIPLLPFLLAGVAGQPTLNQADQIHPNERGHEVISESVFQFFSQQLKDKK